MTKDEMQISTNNIADFYFGFYQSNRPDLLPFSTRHFPKRYLSFYDKYSYFDLHQVLTYIIYFFTLISVSGVLDRRQNMFRVANTKVLAKRENILIITPDDSFLV